jgi:hypothetical protein
MFSIQNPFPEHRRASTVVLGLDCAGVYAQTPLLAMLEVEKMVLGQGFKAYFLQRRIILIK